MTTDFCDRCNLPWRITGGVIREHANMQGLRCSGSGRAPRVSIVWPWAVGA